MLGGCGSKRSAARLEPWDANIAVCDASVGLARPHAPKQLVDSLWDLVAVEASAHPISAPVTFRRLLAPRDKPYTVLTRRGGSCLLLPAIHLSTMAFCWDATCEQYAILQLLPSSLRLSIRRCNLLLISATLFMPAESGWSNRESFWRAGPSPLLQEQLHEHALRYTLHIMICDKNRITVPQ